MTNDFIEDEVYDPSFFFEKEITIQRWRSFIETEEYKSEDSRNLCALMVDCYEGVLDLYRDYLDCYDEKKKKRKKKKFDNAIDKYLEVLEMVEERADAQSS